MMQIRATIYSLVFSWWIFRERREVHDIRVFIIWYCIFLYLMIFIKLNLDAESVCSFSQNFFHLGQVIDLFFRYFYRKIAVGYARFSKKLFPKLLCKILIGRTVISSRVRLLITLIYFALEITFTWLPTYFLLNMVLANGIIFVD